MSILNAFYSLGSKTNKVNKRENDEQEQGASQNRLPELELSMTDEELVALTQKWEKMWNDAGFKGDWEKACEENEQYWKGDHYKGAKTDARPHVDNMIFESLETFLPKATRRNPEPVIKPAGDKPSPEDVEFAKGIQAMAADWADTVKLRMKIKKVARHWSLNMIGAVEVGWNLAGDRPSLITIRPKRLILDPEGFTDEDGYHGRFAGIHQSDEASVLIAKFPKTAAQIEAVVGKDNTGTQVKYIKWMTPSYTCYTLNGIVLDKFKNLHWNYDKPASMTDSVDEFGQPTQVPVPAEPGRNHFDEPKIPIVFLTIFNLGKQPVDETSLIGQNLSGQDSINTLNRQIHKNIRKMNGGQVVSGEKTGLTQEQAVSATEAIDNGGTVYVPQGDASTAFHKVETPGLPADVYNKLQDERVRLRDIFGTSGSTPAGITNEKTVRGKIAIRSLDDDRIGGGITEYLEQFADDVYNWYIQLLYVYKPELFVSYAGSLLVSVKEGTMLPKDTVTLANQAIDLWSAGAIDPITLYERLEDPDPIGRAKRLFLWQNAPQMLFENDPQVQQVMMMKQQQAMAEQQAQANAEMQKQQAGQQGQLQMKQMDNQAKMQQLQLQQQGAQDLKRIPIQ